MASEAVAVVYGDGERLAALSADELGTLCRPTRVELLRAVARGTPASMREAARLVDRDVHGVHDDLRELAGLGVLDLEREGRARRPVVDYDDLRVEVALADGDTGDADPGTE